MIKESFNLGWTFYKKGDENSKKAVTLPHDAMLYENRSKDNPTGVGCAYFAGGTYIYEKSFTVPEDWKNQSVILEFEGVYQKATVSLNGSELCTNSYGYSNFYATLDEALKFGEENILTVIADNSKVPNSRWYSGSGIYREVKLYTGNKQHFVPDSIFVDGTAEGTVNIHGEATGGESVCIVISREGAEIANTECPVENGCFAATFNVENPLLWDDENPNLYDFSAELMSGGTAVDNDKLRFGFRTIALDAKKGFLVNGKPVLLRGSCVHHDNGILGACANAQAEIRKIRIHKEAGFNAIRSSHNPCSKAMLTACDEYGVYMMDEFVDQWLIHKNPYDYANEDFKADWKKDLSAMIKKDWSHPSVIMYSIGNEISELGLKDGVDCAKEMADFVREADSTRPVTAGINLMLATMASKGKGIYSNDPSKDSAGNQSLDSVPTSAAFNMLMNRMGGIIDKMASKKDADKAVDSLKGVFDINGYNYATSRYATEDKKYPDAVIVGSETLPRSAYVNWQYVEKLPYLTGDFVWTGWDYLGESGIGTVQYKRERASSKELIISGGAGLIDICGKMRPEMSWNRQIWHLSTTPEISVEPMTHADDLGSVSMWRDTDGVASWTWPGCEGKKNKVRVYSEAAYVELIVNGKSYGKKKTKEMKAEFKKVTYEPGTIKALAYSAAGTLTGEKELITSRGNAEIKAIPETEKLIANGEDICYINIDITGPDGITISSADEQITAEVTGSGELIAFGSARPAPFEAFTGNKHTTFLGKTQAIIRAGKEPGEVRIKFTSQNSGITELVIPVK